MCGGQSFFSIVLLSASALSYSIATTLGQATASSRVAHMTGDITMANGTVKWFNATKGFGFIAPAGGSKDVFVHITALERAGIRSLPDGQAVTYDVEQDRNGRESAVNLALA
jgi:CspA family cold shock protein